MEETQMPDASRRALAQTCLDGAHDGTMAFPDIVRLLGDAGFDGYAVDFRSNTASYYPAVGPGIVLDTGAGGGPVAAGFDPETVAAQVRWAQSGAQDYSYAAFCRNVRAAGCAGYIVSFTGRRVLYVGRTAETYVEPFPPTPTVPAAGRAS